LGQSEIDAIRALLSSRPRPLGWTERRRRLDEIGSYWPAADDMEFEAVDIDGVPGEWSIVRGSDASRALLYLHGGDYCSGSVYTDLKGLPPMLVQVGSAETLLDDSTRLAAAAGAAAVPVTLEIWPHMIHAWHLWNAHLEPGRQALASAGAFIRRHL
jgi:acetyl esterase/lipase